MPKILENPKDTILNIARDIIIKENYDKLTMRRVSEASGIAVGTLYNYFPTKRDLMMQILEDYWYEYLTVINKIDIQESDFFTKLEKIFRKLEEFINTFLEIFIKNTALGYDENSRTRRDILTEKLIRRLEEILINASDSGVVSLLIEPYELSKFLYMNLLMMAQMKQFEYHNFEKIIKKLLT